MSHNRLTLAHLSSRTPSTLLTSAQQSAGPSKLSCLRRLCHCLFPWPSDYGSCFNAQRKPPPCPEASLGAWSGSGAPSCTCPRTRRARLQRLPWPPPEIPRRPARLICGPTIQHSAWHRADAPIMNSLETHLVAKQLPGEGGGGKSEEAPLPGVGDAHVLLLGREEVTEQVPGRTLMREHRAALLRGPDEKASWAASPLKGFRIKTNCRCAATGKSQHQNNRVGDKKLPPETS